MSDAQGNGNGTGTPALDLVDRLELVFNRADGSLAIGGKVLGDEIALMILERAVRYYETRVRIIQARELQAEALRAAQMAQVTQDILNRRH